MDPQHRGLLEATYQALENGMSSPLVRGAVIAEAVEKHSRYCARENCRYRYIGSCWLFHGGFYHNQLERPATNSQKQCNWDSCLDTSQQDKLVLRPAWTKYDG